MMNKKLITLAVAAALAAPAAAMAEATLYGKLNVSVDYANVKNAIPPAFDDVTLQAYTGQEAVSVSEIWADPAGTEYLTSVEGGGFANTTASSVYIPEYDQAGNLVNVVEVKSGAAYVGSSYEFEDGAFDEVTLIRVDENGNPIVGKSGQDFNGWGVNGQGSYMPGESRANRVGVKGSEDLGNGLKAIYQVEFGVYFGARDDNIPSGNNGGVDMRNSFVGLAGDWGTFLVGRHDTPMKISTGKLDLFVDTMADYNGTVGFQDIRADNAIAYISPSFAGLSFAGAMIAPGGATAYGAENINSDSIAGAYSLALIYSNGPFYASAAYESLSNEMFMDSETSMAGSQACVYADGTPRPTCGYVDDDFNKWRVGLGLLDWNGFTLTAIYENQDNIPAGQTRTAYGFIDPNGNITLASAPGHADEQQLWQVQAGYAFGNSMFKAMYGAVDRGDARGLLENSRDTLSIDNVTKDLEGDRSTWAVGFDHNFSKRTQAYILYTAVDDDNEDNPLGSDQSWDGFSLGMKHSF